VDGDGRLWVLGRTSGDLTWFDGAERASRRAAVDDPATAELVVLDGAAAVVERAGRLVRSVDDSGGFRSEACLEIDPLDRSVRVGGSERARRLYVVSGDDGALRVSDLGSGTCGDVVIEVADPGSDLGAPQESRGRVFVPDYTSGTVIVVDLETREVTRTGELVAPGTEFELFDRDGIVFYNDPGSERAGVVHVDGSFAAVRKYDPDRPGAGVVPADGRDGVPDSEQAGAGDGADDGAVGGDDPGGDGSDAPADPETPEPGGGEPDGPEPDDADPGAAPVPDTGPPAGPTDPATPDVPTPGGPTGEPPAGDRLRIQASALGAEVGEDLTLRVRPSDPDETLADEDAVTWSFGDGDTGTGTPVTHAWGRPGRFRVEATATLEGEPAPFTAFAEIDVVPPTAEPLVADFSYTPSVVEAGSPVTFTDRSTGVPTAWSWDFDGARGAGSSPLPVPPPQVWDSEGTYTVTLTVRRGTDTDTEERAVRVVAPPPEVPDVTEIATTTGPPFDDRTSYEFFAIIVNGPADTCTFTFDGTNVTCDTEPNQAGTRVSASHRFASAGPRTVQLRVTGPGGTATRTLPITVVSLAPPQAAFRVVGATWSDAANAYTAPAGTVVSFDASPTTGDYTSLTWRDETTGAQAVGTSWSPPPLAEGRHEIFLTATGPGGSTFSAAAVEITPPPDTPPTVRALAGPALAFGLGAEAQDPETGIVRFDLYAIVSGSCIAQDGSERTYTEGQRGFPLITAGPSDAGWGTGPDGTVTFIAGYPFCRLDEEWGPVTSFEYWVVAYNGDGITAESTHIVGL
jgi:PKD repeat protein